jgi:hypothetical protein
LQVKVRGKSPVAVAIFSADGRLVRKFTTFQHTIDLKKGLGTGCYLVRAETQGRRMAAKMAVLR